MIKRLCLICAMVNICHCALSQFQSNNWAFGDSCGLSFEADEAIFFSTNIFSLEACASMSNMDGSLLFYTNGQMVWDKLNQIMPNGDSLEIGQVASEGSSITQGVIICPLPDSNSKFYIFQLQTSSDEIYELLYSIVDMNLHSGLGDIAEKNISLCDIQTAEKLQIVKHANGRDWWLMYLNEKPSGKDAGYYFITFLITPSGIEGPFSQKYGPDYDIYDGWTSAGQMKFSADGGKLAVTRGKHADVYDFDRCTGLLSNWIELLNVDEEGLYGCEFSPDGSKLYFTNFGVDYAPKLYQYCFDCYEDISETKKIICKITENYYWLFQLQVAPDNKIYVGNLANDNYEDYLTVNKNLSVINNPNEEGVACNFDTLTVYLGGHTQTLSLPNMPNYNLGALAGSPCDTLGVEINNLENKHEINIYPNPTSNFITVAGLHSDIEYSLEIFNALGERMYAINKLAGLSTLDISDLHHGLYEVVIKSNGIILLNEKLIILQ